MSITILLPLDEGEPGEPETDALVERALTLAEEADGIVHALYVVDTGRYGEPALSSAEIVVDEREDEGHRLLGAVTARGRARGVDVVPRCCHGRPHEELVAHAEEIDADVVVLGGRRRPRKTRDALDEVVDRIEVVAPAASA